MFPLQRGPGSNLPVGVGVGRRPGQTSDKPHGLLCKAGINPCPWALQASFEVGFPLRKQLWIMGVAAGIPIASGPRDPGRLCGPFTGHPHSTLMRISLNLQASHHMRPFQVLLFSHSE